MIFGAKKDISRKEHVGYFTVVQYKDKVHVYNCGQFWYSSFRTFDETVSFLSKEVAYAESL